MKRIQINIEPLCIDVPDHWTEDQINTTVNAEVAQVNKGKKYVELDSYEEILEGE